MNGSRSIPRIWTCPHHGAPLVRGCPRCTSIVRLLIDLVGLGLCTGGHRRELAAEIVIRFAAAAFPDVRATHAVSLAARLYVLTVPEPRTGKSAGPARSA